MACWWWFLLLASTKSPDFILQSEWLELGWRNHRPTDHGIISHVKLNMLYLCNNMFCHATYFGLGKYYRQILANHAMDGIFRVLNFIIF